MGTCASACRIGGQIFVAGALDPNNPCERCQPATSTSAWTPLADGSGCEAAKICAAGVCASSCFIAGAVQPANTINVTGCESCQPAVSTAAWTAMPAAPCCLDTQYWDPGEATCKPVWHYRIANECGSDFFYQCLVCDVPVGACRFCTTDGNCNNGAAIDANCKNLNPHARSCP